MTKAEKRVIEAAIQWSKEVPLDGRLTPAERELGVAASLLFLLPKQTHRSRKGPKKEKK